MEKMYPPVVNSPKTELTELITDKQTEITVANPSVLLQGEGIAVLGNGDVAETITYTSVEDNVLKGCVRGFEGVARAWPVGTRIARNFTAADWKAAQKNIQEIDSASKRIDESFKLISPEMITFPAHAPFRAWQGVCTDGKYIYLTTDNPESGIQDDENIISVYDMYGNFVDEKRNAFTGKDSGGLFMSFGDISFIDGRLYVTAYNINSGGSTPYESKIVQYKTYDDGFNQISVTDIGAGAAECIIDHDEFLWVSYHDQQVIKKFSKTLSLLESYPLPTTAKAYGGYQGIFWENGALYANMHGPNAKGDEFAGGIDKFTFTNNTFSYVETIVPPTFGSTQGMCKYNDIYLFNDRAENRVVIVKSIKTGGLKLLNLSGLERLLVKPELNNSWQKFDATYDRPPKYYKDNNGRVHLSGICKNTSVEDIARYIFQLKKGYRPKHSLNFVVWGENGPLRLGIVGNKSTSTADMAGQVIPTPSGVGWVSLDGVSFLADPDDTTIV
ncbi:hypothetical protein [Paenibacillus polymyxa]|uniref:hypothetical protein n=1 Tax=Paenibacillus polymyxa TaxID=1406 RepID=UPI0021AD9634|nr:hypothetical protein [Paenibacillus polymyxa]